MSAIDILRAEYPGDEAWSRFVDVFRPAWDEARNTYSSFAELGNEEIAIVLSATLGSEAVPWCSRPCGALGRRTPSDVLKTEAHGLVILRTLLMRMPR
jgi:hypothetical protein